MKPTTQHWLMPWRWSRWNWLATIPLLFVMYLFSEAPLDRLETELVALRSPPGVTIALPPSTPVGPGKFSGSAGFIVFDADSPRLFAPAHWFYDHTCLHGPLLKWAELWGVDGEFEDGKLVRRIVAETNYAE